MEKKVRATRTQRARNMKSLNGKIKINENFCKGCGLCVEVCPLHLIHISQRINTKGYYVAELID